MLFSSIIFTVVLIFYTIGKELMYQPADMRRRRGLARFGDAIHGRIMCQYGRCVKIVSFGRDGDILVLMVMAVMVVL